MKKDSGAVARTQGEPGKGVGWERRSSLSDEHIDRMREVLKKYPDARHALFMKNACVRCGWCAESCHYFLSTGDPDLTPAAKSERVRRVLRSSLRPGRSLVPVLQRRRIVSVEERSELYRAAFESCSLCGRCSLSCPVGLNPRRTLYTARSLFASIGELPSGLSGTVEKALELGNYIEMTTEDFVENIEWIAEEVGDELEAEDFACPIDREGAEWLFVPHPLEVRDFPMLLMAAVKILHAAGENYTFSTHAFDTANYAFYQGSRENTLRIARRVLEGRERIGAKNIVLSPCGHGYRVLRWEVEELLGGHFEFKVATLVELLYRYIREGRIQVERDAVAGPFTFHDPCNIGRLGGVIEEPREVLHAVTSDFVEMEPHGVWNLCCGGGGGLSATPDYGQKRVQAGKAKADQIRRTGAKVVVTNCYNCMTQIRELNKAYQLGVEVKSIVELVADSLKGS
jgi:Fe-S oxidoreductase